MLSVAVIDAPADIQDIVPEWRALIQTHGLHLPFQSPDWTLLWWTHFRREGRFARDQLRLFVVRERDGALAAIAPMMVTFRPGVGPVKTRELQFIGADKNITEIRGPICHPSRARAVFAALRAHVAASQCCDWAQWRGLPASAEAIENGNALIPDADLDTIVSIKDVPASWATFHAALPRNIKESLRKCYNSLKRDRHEFEVRVVSSPNEVEAALDRFFDLHRSRADRADTIKHPDIFDTSASRNFLKDYCAHSAARGELRIFEMVIGGEVVATRIGFVSSGRLYLYYSGYSHAWARYSVMTTVVAEAIRWAIGEGCTSVNLSTGLDVSKTRWRPELVAYQGFYEPVSHLHRLTTLKLFQTLRRKKPASSPAGSARIAVWNMPVG